MPMRPPRERKQLIDCARSVGWLVEMEVAAGDHGVRADHDRIEILGLHFAMVPPGGWPVNQRRRSTGLRPGASDA